MKPQVLFFCAAAIFSDFASAQRPNDTQSIFSVKAETQGSIVFSDDLSINRLSIGLTLPLGGRSPEKWDSLPSRNVSLDFKVMQEWLGSELDFDMPDELSSLSFGPSYFYRHNERWSYMSSLNLNYKSDTNSSKDALKVTGFAGTVWKYSDSLDFNFGVAFLGRDDLPVVAGPGFDWRPNESWRFMLRAPIARIEYTLVQGKSTGTTRLYGDIRMAGGTYAVERDNGSDDQLTLSKFPISFGVEHTTDWGSLYGELGYAIGREVNYERGGEDENLDNATRIAFGIRF